LQRPVHHDPLGGQLQILGIREAERAVELDPMQRRRTDVEDDVHILLNGDHVVFGGHLSVRPGGRIRPAVSRRRSSILGVNDSECADEQECWQERSQKERAMLRTHGINPPYSKMTENRSGRAERDPAPSRPRTRREYPIPKIPGMRLPATDNFYKSVTLDAIGFSNHTATANAVGSRHSAGL